MSRASAIALVFAVLTLTIVTTHSKATVIGLANGPRYTELTDAERDAYVASRLDAISAAVAPGRQRTKSPEAVALVRRELDAYAARTASDAKGTPLPAVLERGRLVAPTIAKIFRDAKVPAVVGIYIAMIESEFADCLESPSGAKGMFQIMPATGEKYGLAAEDLCNIEASAKVAAAYINDRKRELGDDAAGAGLSILAYNVGIRSINESFGETLAKRSAAERERSVWQSLANPERDLKVPADAESVRYLPRFLAAAIVGENPADFGIPQPPLSSY
jgi:membrane-bound lytic murein transglycosylase D